MGLDAGAHIRKRHAGVKPGAAILVLLLVFPAFAFSPLTGAEDRSGGRAAEASGGATAFNQTEYHGYDDTTGLLRNLTCAHPGITTLFSIGKTFEGREIWCMKVSDNPLTDEKDEAEALYVGAHHGREWPSVETVLWTLVTILENYGKPDRGADAAALANWTPTQITWLVNNRQLYFIPMLNPDGVEYSRTQYYDQGWTDTNTLWRKNREPNTNPVTGQPYPEQMGGQSTVGTDLNRNYGWHWGEIGYQGYADPTREDYEGPVDTKDNDGDRKVAEDNMDGVDNDRDGRIDEDPRGAFSTRETRAFRDFLGNHRIRILMSYHTFTETGEIYWGFMFTRQLPPDEELFTTIAARINAYNGYDYRNYTNTGDNTRGGPLVDGDLNDYAYGALGILAYCIELRQPAFIVEPGELPDIENINLGPNLLVAELAANPWDSRFNIEHTPLKDTKDIRGPYTVKARISAATDLQLAPGGAVLHYTSDGWMTEETVVMVERDGHFSGGIPGTKENLEFSYFIEARASDGNSTQSPGYAPACSYSFKVLASKRVTPVLLWAHVVVIIGGLGIMVAAALAGLVQLARRRERDLDRVVKYTGISAGLVFLGGFPLGWAVALQRYEVAWTGLPFGWDITDNKTLVIMLMWIGAVLLAKGSMSRMLARRGGNFCPFKLGLKAGARASGRLRGWLERERKDIVGPGMLSLVVILVTVVSLALYLVPHSI